MKNYSNNNPPCIGVVGRGFVGSAVAFGFSPQCGYNAKIKIYDKDPTKSTHTLEETINDSEFIFLSVPTPSNQDGSINLDIVYNVISKISEINRKDDNIILLRSTITPGSTRKIQTQFRNLRIVFNPEFLTERSAKLDFINPSRIILGGLSGDTDRVANLFKCRFGNNVPIIQTNYETAELIKYIANCYFATKISFLNEMKLISDKCGANWQGVIDGLVTDGRIGHSHINVPGHDGKYGFGGSCFPKDVQAMISFAELLGCDLNTLKGAWATNLEVRPERDWEKLLGRAIVKNDDNN
jgi:UDPglucose 6-dehydrogenase